MSEIAIGELWHAIQTGGTELHLSESSSTPGQLKSLQSHLGMLVDANVIPNEYLDTYMRSEYKELLRVLEDASTITLHLVLLKTLCLLHMAMADTEEKIGNVTPLEYLRNRIIPQLREVEYQDETGIISERREWLEAFCLGRLMPDQFRQAIQNGVAPQNSVVMRQPPKGAVWADDYGVWAGPRVRVAP
jgi:hypothetical protein